jgi:hypothetical protein
LQQATEQLEKLAQQLRDQQLSADAGRQLSQQLEQLRDQLQEALAHKDQLQRKGDQLGEQIERLKQQGDQAAAGRLQRRLDAVQKQLDQLQRDNPQWQQLEQLASQLDQCSAALKQGRPQQAASQLQQMAGALQRAEAQLQQLKTLDGMMTEIAAAKAAMSCGECEGMGCLRCQVAGSRSSDDGPPGTGMGDGRGQGDRPEQKTETGSYRTRVAGDPQPGQAVRVGNATGPNRAGWSRQAIREEVAGSISEDPDPMVTERLPRRERRQTREYFQRLRKSP